MQWLMGALQVAIGLGVMLLIGQVILKSTSDDSDGSLAGAGNWFRRRGFAVLNVALAGTLITVEKFGCFFARTRVCSRKRETVVGVKPGHHNIDFNMAWVQASALQP